MMGDAAFNEIVKVLAAAQDEDAEKDPAAQFRFEIIDEVRAGVGEQTGTHVPIASTRHARRLSFRTIADRAIDARERLPTPDGQTRTHSSRNAYAGLHVPQESDVCSFESQAAGGPSST